MPEASAHHQKELIISLLEKADVRINGTRPWDITIHDERLFDRVLATGVLGLGEAYMDGWWECEQLDEFFFRILRTDIADAIPKNLRTAVLFLQAKLFNHQTLKGSRVVAEKHYDLGNNFYRAMLDPYMQYSCGYFKDTDSLATAQEQKLDLICRKLQLKPADHVLDIGCGWGGFAKYASKHYGCHVTGINISKEQIAFAREFCTGLPVEILEQDYRLHTATYDKIVSVGMFEHVGHKNYATYMSVAKRCLKPDGIFLLHSIGSMIGGTDEWINKYIFPNSELPSAQKITEAIDHDFVLEDWHNFGAYYDKTLCAWHHNFQNHWQEFSETYGPRFERMWRYYLLSCAGAFRARRIQLWQVVLTPQGILNGYTSIR